jgi:hypothetical protein
MIWQDGRYVSASDDIRAAFYVPTFRRSLRNEKSTLTLILLMWRIGWAPNSIPIYVYIQQDATLHSLFISGNSFTCFGWYFHPSSGAHTTVSTASGICHTVTAICRCRGIIEYWNILPMHEPINVNSPNNTNKLQMGFNSAFKGLMDIWRQHLSLWLSPNFSD